MPPRTTRNSLRRQSKVDPFNGQPDHIDPIGLIYGQAGIAHIAPSTITNSAGIAIDAPDEITLPHSPGQTNTAPDVITHMAGTVHDTPASIANPLLRVDNARETRQNPGITMRHSPREGLLRDAGQSRSTLPRTQSTGIGRFRIDTDRLINNLNLDTTVPIRGTQALPSHGFAQRHENAAQTLPHVQMIHPTYFDVLARMLRAMGATAEEADRWTASYVFGDSNTAASQHQIQMSEEAVRRASIAFPNLHNEHVPAPPDARSQDPAAPTTGAPHISVNGPNGATITEPNARFTISYPPRFKPHETNWFLWVPQVERFFIRVKLDPTILSKAYAHLFTAEQHANALSIITEIAPERESQWFARLNFTHAHSAWDELTRAYAPRAELELQAKIEDLENISQSETESIRDWTLRLRRLVLEVQAMHGEHVVTPTAHKLKLLRIRPIPGQEDGFSAFIGDLRQSLHLKTVEEIETKLTAYEDGIQMQARLRPAGTQLWHTYAGNSKTPTIPPPLPTAATFKRAPKGNCYICFNDFPSRTLPHHMKDCFKKDEPVGRRVATLMKEHKAANPAPPPPPPKKRGAAP
jgi:hypothetical protein